MSYTASQVNTLFQTILQRPADIAAINTFAGRPTDQDAQIRTQIETSNEAAVNVNPIVRLYQGAFNRLPDTAGLQANVTNYTNGYNINATATAFLAGPEAAAIFGSANPTVTTSFVSTVYQNALNRTAGASETAYWVSTGKSAGQVLAEISNSQEAVNKLAVPTISFLDAQATSTTSLGGSGNSSVTGTLYNQTATNFVFDGGANAIVGSVNNDTASTTGGSVNAGDTLNFGGGTDTLNIDVSGAAVGGVPTTINGLEVINVIGNRANTLNFSTANGLALATIRNSTTGGDAITLKAGVLGGLDNVVAAATETFTFTGTPTFGSVAVANGTSVDAVALNNASITTLNVLSTGSTGSTATNVIRSLTSTGTETTINVSGDKAVTIGTATAAGIDASVTTFNAANLTGAGVTVTVGTSDIAVTGGSGNDKFIFLGTSLTSADTVVGGLGTDSVQVAGADYALATNETVKALNTKVSGVEQLEFVGAGATTIDGNTFTNAAITNLLFNTTAADIIDNAGSARLYTFGETNTGNATFNLKSGATAVNLSLEAIASDPTAIATLAVNAAADAPAGTASTINITSNLAAGAAATAANAITTLTANAGSTVNLGGAQDITIGTLTNGGTISGGAFTGKFILTNGSTGNDLILLGSGGSELNTGAGNDTISVVGGTNLINGGDGVDTISLGSGSDTVTLASTSANRDLVNTFSISADKLAFGTAATTLNTAQGGAAVVTNDTTTAGAGGGAYTLTGVTSANADVIKLQSGASLTSGTNGGDLNASIDGTELLKALTSNAGADTYTGITATNGNSTILLATQGTTTYVYQAVEANADGLYTAAEIQLVGALTNVSAANFTTTNFTVLA